MAATNGCPSYFRLYCKRQGPGGYYCVTVRNGKLCLTRPCNGDSNQMWYKDNSYKVGVMLVNQCSGKVVKHSKTGVQLELVNKPCHLDKSVLWSESADMGCGYTLLKTTMILTLLWMPGMVLFKKAQLSQSIRTSATSLTETLTTSSGNLPLDSEILGEKSTSRLLNNSAFSFNC